MNSTFLVPLHPFLSSVLHTAVKAHKPTKCPCQILSVACTSCYKPQGHTIKLVLFFVRVCICTQHVHSGGDQRLKSGILLNHPPPTLLCRQSLSLSTEIVDLARLAGQRTPTILSSLPPQHCGGSHVSVPSFLMNAGDQRPRARMASPSSTEPSPSLSKTYFQTKRLIASQFPENEVRLFP